MPKIESKPRFDYSVNCGEILGARNSLKKSHLTKYYKCDHLRCGRVLSSGPGLKFHKQAKHPLPEEVGIKPCHLCPKRFNGEEQLRIHVYQSHSKRKIKCDQCPAEYKSSTMLKQHTLTVHERRKDFHCDKCPSKFVSANALKCHSYAHSTERNFQCDECPARFKMKVHLYRHKGRMHSTLHSYQCSTCNKTFSSKDNIKRHERSHTNERRFKCYFCPTSCKTSDVLQIHVRIHTQETPFPCRFKECAYATGSMTALASHIRHRHTFIKTKSELRTQTCYFCYKTVRHSRIHLHVTLHTMERRFFCGLCRRRFNSPGSLSTHVNDKHTLEARCHCEICGKQVVSAGKLREHMASHTNEKRYFCDIPNCKYASYTMGAQRRHRPRHFLHEKNFSCDICSKKFITKSEAKVHRKSHSSKRAWCCYMCEATYKKTKNLERHYCNHTRERPYPCEFKGTCKKWYKAVDELNRHLSKAHGVPRKSRQVLPVGN